MKTMEDRLLDQIAEKQVEIDQLKEVNTQLKGELEVTQAVVDELLFGGGM